MPASLILRLVSTAGPFIRSLSFMGHGQLLANTLTDVTTHLCMEPAPLGGLSRTQLTSLNLQGCAGLTTRSLHHLLIRSPSLQKLSLKGLSAATNTTCDVIAAYCPYLVSLNLSGCSGLDASGLLSLASAAISRGGHLLLTELRISGLKAINDTIMATLGKAAPYLEILDLSYVRHLHNSALQAFVSCEASFGGEMVELTSRQAGHDPGNPTKYRRRLTRLRHLSLSSCVLLTDIACSHLAYSMPRLEYLELAGIGAELRDDGLVRLLGTTPYLRRLDLEDASEITDDVLTALTPDSEADAGLSAPKHSEPQTGHMLEHLIISFAANVTDNALFDLIRGCTHLRVLEADNTPISSAALKEFVRLSRQRRIMDSRIVAIDCRGISESVVNELSTTTRPRLGWRSYHARKLRYLDGRDKEDLKVGQDECDETRVVLKTFHSWQMVDAVKAAREKRRKSTSRRAANDSNGSVTDSEDFLLTNTARARWWSPSGRRISGGNSPTTLDTNSNEGCRIM
jgi:F-box/leucine-rich repeat protein 2/20